MRGFNLIDYGLLAEFSNSQQWLVKDGGFFNFIKQRCFTQMKSIAEEVQIQFFDDYLMDIDFFYILCSCLEKLTNISLQTLN